jgi:hypothetical protein
MFYIQALIESTVFYQIDGIPEAFFRGRLRW